MSEGFALLRYIQRFENINEQITELKADKAEIASEAKSNGYDMKAIGILLKERASDPEVQKQQDLIVDLYRRRIAEAEHDVEMKARAPSDERITIQIPGEEPIETNLEQMKQAADALESEAAAGRGKRKARDKVAA